MQMQKQVIIQDKMAALGNLVAGISHELNSPLGAINSMHNTLIRAIDKLKGALNQDFSQEYEDNRTIQSSFQVMADANRVITTGAERVTRIVRSLRSFTGWMKQNSRYRISTKGSRALWPCCIPRTKSPTSTPSSDIDNTSQHERRLEEGFQSRLLFESAFLVSGCGNWIFVF